MVQHKYFLALAVLVFITAVGQADIFRWDTGELIPGTEGIVPRAHIRLTDWNSESHNLQYADFSGIDLKLSDMDRSWLDFADFRSANLTRAAFRGSVLANANFSQAIIDRANFSDTTSSGFTKEQLYSTASYQAKDLYRISLSFNDLSGWDFRDQDLGSTDFSGSGLANADLTGAIIVSADFSDTTSSGFTKEQLYSTASYQAKDLRRIRLS
ncbi:MAG: pentapeptide repeat-containing protein, partial [Planctomycetales bacterium]|nr:pentapeptide repeat-containing protein [Planctomycetales bacterium]